MHSSLFIAAYITAVVSAKKELKTPQCTETNPMFFPSKQYVDNPPTYKCVEGLPTKNGDNFVFDGKYGPVCFTKPSTPLKEIGNCYTVPHPLIGGEMPMSLVILPEYNYVSRLGTMVADNLTAKFRSQILQDWCKAIMAGEVTSKDWETWSVKYKNDHFNDYILNIRERLASGEGLNNADGIYNHPDFTARELISMALGHC